MLPIPTSVNTAKAAPFRSSALVSGALSAAGAAAGTAACSAVVLLSRSPIPSSVVRFTPCVGDGFALVSDPGRWWLYPCHGLARVSCCKHCGSRDHPMGLSGLSLVSFVFGAPLGSGTAFFSFSSSFSFLSSTISTGAAEPAAPSSEPAAEPTARLASSSSLLVS